MKFYGEPNRVVTLYIPKKRKHKFLFKFDENGEYQTTNKKRIAYLKGKFEHEEDYEEYTYNELKKISAEREINTYGLNKEQIKLSLRAGERVLSDESE